MTLIATLRRRASEMSQRTTALAVQPAKPPSGPQGRPSMEEPTVPVQKRPRADIDRHSSEPSLRAAFDRLAATAPAWSIHPYTLKLASGQDVGRCAAWLSVHQPTRPIVPPGTT